MRHKHLVNLDDLDFMGIVSHYKWVELLERYRTLSWDSKFQWLQQKKWGLIVVKADIQYLKPAAFRDKVFFEDKVKSIKFASFELEQMVTNENHEQLIKASLRFCCVDDKLKPINVAKELSQIE